MKKGEFGKIPIDKIRLPMGSIHGIGLREILEILRDMDSSSLPKIIEIYGIGIGVCDNFSFSENIDENIKKASIKLSFEIGRKISHE